MLSRSGKLAVVVSALLTILACSLGAGVAAAATPAPGWHVLSIPDPTALSSKPEFGYCTSVCQEKYTILVANVGAVESHGTITLTDRLPAGVTTAATPGNEQPASAGGTQWACAPAGPEQSSVTCTNSAEDAAANGGYLQALRVPVEVSDGVPSDSTLVNTVEVSGGGAPAPVSIESPTSVNPGLSLPFEVADLGALIAEPAGGADTQAGAHPSSFTFSFDATSQLNTDTGTGLNQSEAVENLKEVVVDLPPGLVGDPLATPRCPLTLLVRNSNGAAGHGESACSPETRVGMLLFSNGGGYGDSSSPAGSGAPLTPIGISQWVPVYNLVPEHGHPAEFGFTFAGYPFVLYASVVGHGASAHVRVSAPGIPGVGTVEFQGAVSTFFGDPTVQDGVGSGVPFLTDPSRCTGAPLTSRLHIDSYENPGAYNADGTPDLSDPAWKGANTESPGMSGCGSLPFEPTIEALPTSRATDAPSGFDFDLRLPQSENQEGLAEGDLDTAMVRLPEGLVVNPAAAGGLAACSEAQIALESNDPPECPEASKLATVLVSTPLLEHPLPGSLYLAREHENPFGSLLAGYIVIDDPETGIVLKLAGEMTPDPVTGRLTARFDENPQFPFEEIKIDFKEGQRGPLTTPSSCGTYTTTSTLTPWGAPETPDAAPASSFTIDEGCGAGGFSPSFTAGTSNPQAGGFSPFGVTFSRKSSEQAYGNIDVTLPPGLLGVIKGLVQCPEPQASKGECGAGSLIGEATATVGAGENPYTVTGGEVYLTGPYNGGPFGLSVVVPTTAGPFTLTGNGGYGKEVVRSSIRVNPNTAQVTVISDPLPSILEGIPLQIRTVNVTINRPNFTFNPTNCSSSSVTATIASSTGTSSMVSSPFAANNCAALKFAPQFSASTQANGTTKGHGASLDVKIGYPQPYTAYANIAKTDVSLPLALSSRLTTLQKACTESQFGANPADCPAGSDVGTATGTTPALNGVLTGPAYLVSHGGRAFPDLDLVLQGENGIEIVLTGNTDIKDGITYSKFETVPDAPVSSFEVNIPEKEDSLLSAVKNLCAPTKTVTMKKKITVKRHGKPVKVTKKVTKTEPEALIMPTTITAQNGAVLKQNTKITVTGCTKAKPAKKTTKKNKAKNKKKDRK